MQKHGQNNMFVVSLRKYIQNSSSIAGTQIKQYFGFNDYIFLTFDNLYKETYNCFSSYVLIDHYFQYLVKNSMPI